MKNISVYFETGYLLDSSYERASVNQKTIARLLPQFQKSWDDYGSLFIGATLKEIGKDFHRSELLAYLIMHPEVFSCSHPFLININQFLDFDPSSNSQSMQFSELVYHELLHIYLDDNYSHLLNPASPRATDLIKRFSNEDDVVTAHLHLYAIQKSAFKKSEWTHVWEGIIANAKSLHSPGYKRAIEIVNSVGYDVFVEELKNG